MNKLSKLIIIAAALLLPAVGFTQDGEAGDRDSLKIAALEALMSAPPERAMPIVDKVLAGEHSTEDHPEHVGQQVPSHRVEHRTPHDTLLDLNNLTYPGIRDIVLGVPASLDRETREVP